MSNRLYKRFLELLLVKPVIQTSTSGSYFAELPNAVTIRDMRVKFSIEKNLGKHPNKATITITNLASTTRTQIEALPLIVKLAVGYDGIPNLHELFSGDLRIADTTHDGPDVNTKLQLGEGDRAFQFARVSRSFAGGSKVLDVVKDITKSIGLELPPSIAAASDLQAQFGSGITIHGLAHQELSNLLTPIGMGWSIQDGNKLVILKEAQVRENEAVLIEEGRGMVGSPAFGSPKKAGEGALLKTKCLINPLIVAGGLIQVHSRDVKGTFRAEKIKHEGDTRAKDWYTEVEARRL